MPGSAEGRAYSLPRACFTSRDNKYLLYSRYTDDRGTYDTDLSLPI